MKPGQVERREYHYERHSTTCLFGNKNVATGEIVAPMLNATRTEEDFVKDIEGVIATAPDAGWVFVLDHLNTHLSALKQYQNNYLFLPRRARRDTKVF